MSATANTRLSNASGVKPAEQGSRDAAFVLFCVFLLSYFLRLTVRVPALGAAHLDILLASFTVIAILFSQRSPAGKRAPLARGAVPLDPTAVAGKRLMLLCMYIFATLPFVEWPGSVLSRGLEPFAKALSFFLFVVMTANTPRKLQILLRVYVGAQVFRVLEPLYMHFTTGYWGSFTGLGNWEYMDRLSGSPYDIINPNGLGFLVVTILPVLHFLVAPTTVVKKAVWTALVGLLCYALVLSASRSSFLALIMLGLIMIYRSPNRGRMLIVAGVVSVVALGLMNDLQRERYLSIFSHSARGSGTAEGRINGVIADLEVAMRKPIFGHGLGNSREANANFRGEDMLSHDLYTEIAEELGVVGLGIFLSVILEFVRNCYAAKKVADATPAKSKDLEFLSNISGSLLVLVGVYLFFSFASYGLSEPYWYFIGGLSVVTARMANALSCRQISQRHES